VPVKLSTPDAEAFGTALAELVDLVFGDEEGQALLAMRLEAWLQDRPPQLSDAQKRVAALVQAKVAALVGHSFADLGTWQTQLRALANQLEDLETGARAMVDAEQSRPGRDVGASGERAPQAPDEAD
jgi:hypothetical protein